VSGSDRRRRGAPNAGGSVADETGDGRTRDVGTDQIGLMRPTVRQAEAVRLGSTQSGRGKWQVYPLG
jgi:hypothetical protein